MEKGIDEIDVAKVSTKGQLVIPQGIRKRLKIKEGSMFAVASCDGTLVLKKIESPLNEEDIRTLRMVDEAWDDIEKGRYRRLSKDDFLKEIGKW